jgi:hypothetical protein
VVINVVMAFAGPVWCFVMQVSSGNNGGVTSSTRELNGVKYLEMPLRNKGT